MRRVNNPSARSAHVCSSTERPWSPRSPIWTIGLCNPKWRHRTALSLVWHFHWNMKWVICACQCICPRHYMNFVKFWKANCYFFVCLHRSFSQIKSSRHWTITRTVDSVRKTLQATSRLGNRGEHSLSFNWWSALLTERSPWRTVLNTPGVHAFLNVSMLVYVK